MKIGAGWFTVMQVRRALEIFVLVQLRNET